MGEGQRAVAAARGSGQPKKRCNCVEQVQKQAKEQGFQLVRKLTFDFDKRQAGLSGPLLLVERTEDAKRGRKPLPTVECAYCPFCGKKIP